MVAITKRENPFEQSSGGDNTMTLPLEMIEDLSEEELRYNIRAFDGSFDQLAFQDQNSFPRGRGLRLRRGEYGEFGAVQLIDEPERIGFLERTRGGPGRTSIPILRFGEEENMSMDGLVSMTSQILSNRRSQIDLLIQKLLTNQQRSLKRSLRLLFSNQYFDRSQSQTKIRDQISNFRKLRTKTHKFTIWLDTIYRHAIRTAIRKKSHTTNPLISKLGTGCSLPLLFQSSPAEPLQENLDSKTSKSYLLNGIQPIFQLKIKACLKSPDPICTTKSQPSLKPHPHSHSVRAPSSNSQIPELSRSFSP